MNRNGRIAFLLMGAALLLAALPATGHAIVIQYQTVNLTDINPGQDLWRYDYRVTDFLFTANQGFTVYFDQALYSGLDDPPPAVIADWDPIVLQPDTGLPAAGAYDALALVDGASLFDAFTVSFVWLGTGAPGAQLFDVYRLDSLGGLVVLASGSTTPVPEPATMLLLACGMGGLILVRRRWHLRMQ
jgi:hypothetical protein